MPTYAYACTECDHRFDAVQSFSDNALTDCPECSGRLRKLFSAVGIVFKGSGFYRTDSRTQNNGNGSDGAKPKPAETTGSNGSGATGSGATGSGATKEPAAASTAKPSSSGTTTT